MSRVRSPSPAPFFKPFQSARAAARRGRVSTEVPQFNDAAFAFIDARLAVPRVDGLAAGFLPRVRVAAARAAVLRRAARRPFVFFVDLSAFDVLFDGRRRAVARFADGSPPR